VSAASALVRPSTLRFAQAQDEETVKFGITVDAKPNLASS